MERLDIRRTLIGSAALCAAATAGIALSLDDGVPLLIFRALSGIFFSVFIVATVAAQSILLDEKSRGLGFALFTTGSMLPLATVVPFCEWLIKCGFGAVYLWTAPAISILCAAAGWKTGDLNYAGKEKSEWGSYSDLFHTKGFPVLLLTAITMSLADAGTLSVASLAGARGVSVSYFMMASAASAVVIRTLGFGLISKAPRVKLAAPAVAVMGGALFGLAFCSSALSFAFFGALFGLGIGAAYPTNFSLIGDLTPPRLHPKATALVLLVIDVGWIVSPLIYGCFPRYWALATHIVLPASLYLQPRPLFTGNTGAASLPTPLPVFEDSLAAVRKYETLDKIICGAAFQRMCLRLRVSANRRLIRICLADIHNQRRQS